MTGSVPSNQWPTHDSSMVTPIQELTVIHLVVMDPITGPFVVQFDPDLHDPAVEYTLTGFSITESYNQTTGEYDTVGDPAPSEIVFYGSDDLAFNLKTVTYSDGWTGKEIESIAGECSASS